MTKDKLKIYFATDMENTCSVKTLINALKKCPPDHAIILNDNEPFLMMTEELHEEHGPYINLISRCHFEAIVKAIEADYAEK